MSAYRTPGALPEHVIPSQRRRLRRIFLRIVAWLVFIVPGEALMLGIGYLMKDSPGMRLLGMWGFPAAVHLSVACFAAGYGFLHVMEWAGKTIGERGGA